MSESKTIQIVVLPLIFSRFDFYIVSQSVREGTVAPTYYDVIHHQCSLPPDAMQQMTYMLCHMYFNWPVNIKFFSD